MEYDKLPGNVGIRPRLRRFRMTATSGATANLIYRVQVTSATAANLGLATTVALPGVTDPLIESAVYLVALEDVAAGERGWFALSGWVQCVSDSAGCAADTSLVCNSAGALQDLDAVSGTATQGAKVVAVAPEAIAGDATGYVWFNGEGYGGAGHDDVL